MTQQVKHFLYQHEDLSLDPENPGKARHSSVYLEGKYFCSKMGAETVTPQASWGRVPAVCSVETVKMPSQTQEKMRADTEVSSDVCMCPHSHT